MKNKEHPDHDRISGLDPSAEEIRQWGNAAIEVMAGYLDSIRDRRVYPQTSSRQIRETGFRLAG